MHSIKTKLILSISVFVIFLFSVTALLLIDEKKKELSRDIYLRARSVSELTSPKIVELYETLLAEKSFVIFNRDIKDIFRKDEDIAEIKLTTFAGEVLYDSSAERDRAYEGEPRRVGDSDTLARVRANLPSYLLESGRTVFLKKTPDGEYLSVNENEQEMPEISDTDVILNIVYPLAGKYAVQFDVSYENLQARVVRTTERIVLLLIFGVLLGLGFGWSFSSKITNPIEKLTAGALIIGKGNFTARVKVEVKDEVGVLADTFNKMAADLEVSTKAMIEKEKLSKELEVAARIQKQILPKSLPAVPGLEVAAELIPATEIGGDCYDFIQLDEQSHMIYIGDVTGHGIPAGIVASIANAVIYSYANAPTLQEIIVSANRVMKGKTAQNMFMTMLMVRYREGSLDYISAGHPEMLHFSASQKKVASMKGGGIAMGMVPDISKMLSVSSVEFNKGDALVLYSDGIPEAANPRGEMYGIARLKRILNEIGETGNAEAIKNAIIADVKDFMGGSEQLDDITVIVLRKT